MRATIKYENGGDECTIRTSDGGIATCHHNGEYLITELYQSRTFKREPNWDELSEGKKYIKDWEGKHEIDSEVILDALNWLVMSQPKWSITEHWAFPPPALGLRKCITCKDEKTRDWFYRDNRNVDGMTSECKICKDARMKIYTNKIKKMNNLK